PVRPDRPDRSDRPIIPPWQERRPYNRPEGLRPEGMRPEGMRGEGMPPMRAGEWRRGLNNPAATRPIGPEEMQDIDHFMKLWSPKRWARLKEMPEDRQERLRGFVAARYRALQALKQNDREMYDIRLGR